MNEHRETRTPTFSENLDSTQVTVSKDTVNLDTDTLATTSLTSNVSTCTPTEPLVLLYETDTSTLINSMAVKPDEERSLPFLQRVQLAGPGDYSVRATGQVDDGAMRNCISKHRWERYGHCLSPLEPSTTRIKVANGSTITPLGRWHGTVRVGNIGAPSWFEVFECGNAFDVILGKPWLKAVKAVHDYSTDEITITHDGESKTIPNSATHTTDKVQSVTDLLEATPMEDDNLVLETDPIEQLDREWARIHQIRASTTPWQETHWSQYLDMDDMDEDDEDLTYEGLSDLYTTEDESLSTRERRAHDVEKLRQRRENEGEVLLSLAISEAEALREQERIAQRKCKRNKKRTRKSTPVSADPDLDHVYLLAESEARVHRLRSHLEYLRVINEPEPSDSVYSLDPYSPCDRMNDFDDDRVLKLGDLRHTPFKIDRGSNKSLRVTDPHSKERVNEILSKVEIGTDLSEEQRSKVKDLIKEFADVFALSMSEVLIVDWHQHHLDIDPDVKLPKRMSQRPITENQKDWYYRMLDEMEASSVIQKVPGEFIKCLSSTNLAPKEAGKTGTTKVEVLRKVNAECIKNGLPPFWEEAILPGESNEALLDAVEGVTPNEVKTKWRICHAFMALNRATQIPPFPQGDLNGKHQFAAGHRWASVIDFAAGYYAIQMSDESVPYTAFYVEGRGYYVYLRMPFGLTGAPATFGELIAIALDDMIGRELVNWMDDICLPGDDFDTKMSNLRKFFTRCREKSLSLSPSKTKLFFTEVLFAGAMIGPSGIKPNLDKVAAVVNWPEPQDVQDLMAFLGLTNYFRRLINDYARIAAPLTDLTRNLQIDIPKRGWKARKGAYKCALQSISLKDKWTSEHQRAFVTLKIILSSEPVVRSPQYDGRPFRVTTDGSGDGLAGWLSQPFKESDSSGKTITRWYPISFCSKRTSPSESRYEPFLLEFAALKFSIDEFEPFIFGAPIEVETDCQALRDCLLKDKLNTHHSRWMQSILSHNIIDIRHRPGIQNPVADGLSRMWHNRKRSTKDGSHWSVLPDWEASKGIKNDIMSVLEVPSLSEHPLEAKFKGDIFFTPIVRHLLGKSVGDSISERRRAMHRAGGFMIEGDKLWRVSTRPRDRVPRAECRPAVDGFKLALDVHQSNGHFSADALKLHLRDRYFWPGLDTDCRQACIECPQCKGFGPAKLNALLQPIRRVRPFDLTAGDYVSLPKGKGGFKTLGVYIDTCSNFVWVSRIKSAGTSSTTLDSLRRICLDYATPRAFMTDGGSHFKNGAVDDFCTDNEIQHIVTPAYAPWVNGLVESTNNLLLSRLKRMCAPDLDEDDDVVDANSIPWNWPDHLDEAVRAINDRIIPTLNASPREILFGMALHPDSNTEPPITPQPLTTRDLDTHFTLANTLRYNTHLRSITEADRKKQIFDSNALVPNINIGDLVQVYDSKADFNFATINKLAPRWSIPRLITGKYLNSFALSTLNGIPLSGLFHIRRLRPYIPLRGSTLDLIHPRDVAAPTTEDLEVAEVEERMADDLYRTPP